MRDRVTDRIKQRVGLGKWRHWMVACSLYTHTRSLPVLLQCMLSVPCCMHTADYLDNNHLPRLDHLVDLLPFTIFRGGPTHSKGPATMKADYGMESEVLTKSIKEDDTLEHLCSLEGHEVTGNIHKCRQLHKFV